MGAINQMWPNPPPLTMGDRLESYHLMKCPAGTFRFQLWSSGWEVQQLIEEPNRLTKTKAIANGLTDEEMMGWIKLLRGTT